MNLQARQKIERINSAIRQLGDILDRNQQDAASETERIKDLTAKLWEARRINSLQEKEIAEAAELAADNERLKTKHQQIKTSLKSIKESIGDLREVLTP